MHSRLLLLKNGYELLISQQLMLIKSSCRRSLMCCSQHNRSTIIRDEIKLTVKDPPPLLGECG